MNDIYFDKRDAFVKIIFDFLRIESNICNT